jgi:DNA-binding CsgD family transcriptional regulator
MRGCIRLSSPLNRGIKSSFARGGGPAGPSRPEEPNRGPIEAADAPRGACGLSTGGGVPGPGGGRGGVAATPGDRPAPAHRGADRARRRSRVFPTSPEPPAPRRRCGLVVPGRPASRVGRVLRQPPLRSRPVGRAVLRHLSRPVTDGSARADHLRIGVGRVGRVQRVHPGGRTRPGHPVAAGVRWRGAEQLRRPVPAVRRAAAAGAGRRLVHLAAQELGPLLGTVLAAGDPGWSNLPPRWRQTLDCLLDGDSEKQAAVRLGISPQTAHQYVKGLYGHFGVSSRGELLALFLRRCGAARSWREPGRPPA